jgi:superfamily II DNA or RNA helicase
MMIAEHAYLTQKGYTIPKTALTPLQLEQLRQDLFKKPVIHGINKSLQEGFPIYRENEKKIYLPRYYGIQHFGIPTLFQIPPGNDINTPFTQQRSLFPHQTKAVDAYLQSLTTHPCKDSSTKVLRSGGGILELACGMGKTVIALHLVSRLQKKTLILVHKEFLMNQWIERIEEYLPTARIGKLQGPKQEIEGNDIVIGMIQSIYNREFPPGMFDSFGFTIIDEVHRIGSCEFSQTLSKIVTPLTLGISATVERKDGLTDILFAFIGPKIFSASRESNSEQVVQVRAVTFQTQDRDFCEVEYDFRGQVKYSTMMTRLCNYAPRTDLLERLIRDTYERLPQSQIIVLGHNRSLLVDLYKRFQRPHAIQPSVGYYIGGMKQAALQASETCSVLLATFAMAAEALDIKTLSVLVLATPKTDIVQSVGRILRTQHSQPIILDIVDILEPYQNQWKRRRAYYRKCGYDIRETTSVQYTGDMSSNIWKKYVPRTRKGCAVEEEDEGLTGLEDMTL